MLGITLSFFNEYFLCDQLYILILPPNIRNIHRLCGTIQSISSTSIEFSTPWGTRKLPVGGVKAGDRIIKYEPCGSHLDDNVENLVDLDELSEGAILHHVRTRFLKKVELLMLQK